MKKITACLLAFIILSANAFADLIYLKDGKVLDAYIVEQNSSEVIVNDGTHNIKIPLSNLKGIKKKLSQDIMPSATPAASGGGAQADMKTGPKFKLVPSDDELKIAEYECYTGLSEVGPQMEKMNAEMEQMKVIMGMELVLIAAGAVIVLVKK
ncbi:MAG: hypothetical protein ABSA34_00305 [Candidatus Goldiibacteriota bacterium]|jgi:hypothetical protein